MSFTVYKSSAGSGKTTALVREYIKLILPNPSGFSQILAISFTNKAANEMKIRIVRDLQKLSAIEGNCDKEKVNKIVPGLYEALSSEYFDGFADLPQRSAKALAFILHHYSDFAVSTIDSFVHGIVRFFASDLFLSHDFEVELEEKSEIKKAVGHLISKAGEDIALTNFLVDYSLSLTDEEKNWNIEFELARFAKILFKESAQIQLPKLSSLNLNDFVRYKHLVSVFVAEFEKVMFECGNEAMNILISNSLEVEDFYQKNKGVAGLFFKLANRDKRAFVLKSAHIKTIDEDIWYTNSTPSDIKLKIDRVKDELRLVLYKIKDLLLTPEYTRYILYQMLGSFMYRIALLSEIQKIFEDLRQEDNIVHISEFNKRIADIVLHEPVPYIYERLGNSYKNYLIDEFQDTSVLQWVNLLPLIENSLSEGCFNMVVGDGKQAIYRWRNGNVEQFAGLPEIPGSGNDAILKQRENALKLNYKFQDLQVNYRSGKEIVDFNNRLFQHLASLLPEKFSAIYDGVCQKAGNSNNGGKIEIHLAPIGTKAQDLKELQLLRVYDKIIEYKKDGFFNKDIAILVRDNANASNIASFLLENNIDVVSSESLLLKNSEEVRVLINMAKIISNPKNKVACAAVLHYLTTTGLVITDVDMSDTVVDFNSNGLSQGQLISILSQNDIKLSFADLKIMPVYDMFEEIARVFKLFRKPNPFVQFFFEKILELSAAEEHDLLEIIEQWEENKDKFSIALPEEMDAVRIMTIHKAKGLEFPAVIFPFYNPFMGSSDFLWVEMNDDNLPGFNVALLPVSAELDNTSFSDIYNLEVNRQRLDMINLLYVVMTRACRRIYVSGPNYKNDFSKSDKADSLKTFPSMLKSFLLNEGLYKEDQLLYEFGDSGSPEVEKSKRSNIINIEHENIISASWASRARISINASDAIKGTGAVDWGNIVHKLLSLVERTTDTDKLLSEFSAHYNPDLETELKLKMLLNNIIANNDIMSLIFEGDTILAEQEILNNDGKSYRPDRIVIKGNSAKVIDFKTGKPSDSHKVQVDRYCDLLLGMGYKMVGKHLVYINESGGELVEW